LIVILIPAPGNSNAPGFNSGLPMRIASGADVPAIGQLINAAFVVERPIFDHDRTDDRGVRDYMTKGKFLLHENRAGNLIACVYLGRLLLREYNPAALSHPTAPTI
jgi:hypothetical protein